MPQTLATGFTCPEPYADRPTAFLGVREIAGWRLKTYSVVYGSRPLDTAGFAEGLPLVEEVLPDPAVTPLRPGVGILLMHQGRDVDYLVLAWWGNHNELPIRVFVREAGRRWRAAQGDESVCVWDLQVIGFERDAYVKHVMQATPDVAAYLAAVRAAT